MIRNMTKQDLELEAERLQDEGQIQAKRADADKLGLGLLVVVFAIFFLIALVF